MQQAPDKRPWIHGDQVLLPFGENDGSFVLSAGSVLWKQATPVIRR
jgi:hypothetical protein